jgi:hypothetical protein
MRSWIRSGDFFGPCGIRTATKTQSKIVSPVQDLSDSKGNFLKIGGAAQVETEDQFQEACLEEYEENCHSLPSINAYKIHQRGLPGVPVFLRDGKPITSIREAFQAARLRAGLDGFNFHDLRRLAAYLHKQPAA